MGNAPKMLGEYVASAPLTPLVKPGGGIRPIHVGTVWRRLVFKVSAVMIGHSLDRYFDDLQFGFGVSGGGDAILHAVNRLIEDVVMTKFAFVVLLFYVGWDFVTLTQLGCIIGNTSYGCANECRAWYIDDDTIIEDTLVMRRVSELIIMDGPSCGLHLNVDKTEVLSLHLDLDSVIGNGDLLPYPFRSEGLVSILQIDLISNPSEIDAPKLMKKLADKYFTRVSRTVESTFYLSHQHMDLWKSQMEDDTSDRLRVVFPYSLFQNPFLACSKGFIGYIYRDNVVSRADIIGIKPRDNIVRDTLVDICFRLGILTSKEVDIGLGGGRDKPLRLADMLLYS
ncbi:hypothetical protein Tco_1354417 [Tanacetum coccineum]